MIFRIYRRFPGVYGFFLESTKFYMLDVIDPAWVDSPFMQDLGGHRSLYASSIFIVVHTHPIRFPRLMHPPGASISLVTHVPTLVTHAIATTNR